MTAVPVATSVARPPDGAASRPPIDRQAWVSFAIASVGGVVVAFYPRLPDAATVALVASMAGLVIVSEWITSVMDRFRDRSGPGPLSRSAAVPRRSDARGTAVLAGCVILAGAFLSQLPESERQVWIAVLATLGAGVGVLFLLRLEWVPVDRRLLVLTHVLLTVPCLLLGFRAWGVGAARAFAVWAPLALFLPGVVLVERAWMDGPTGARNALTVGLLPTLLGAAGLALADQRLVAAYFALWTVRAGVLVLARQASDSTAIPSFRSIRAFGRETCWWVGGFVVAWVGMWVWGG